MFVRYLPVLIRKMQVDDDLRTDSRFAFEKLAGLSGKVTVVLGAQWGDEGKGKLVDILAQRYNAVGRFNGGANAGHTLVVKGVKFAFHLLPCGMLYPNCSNVIGNGVVVHIPTMLEELKRLDEHKVDYEGRLKISNRAHILFDFHRLIDGAQESHRGKDKIGTTKRGIGPCYSSKMNRNGVRMGTLMEEWDVFVSKYNSLFEYSKARFPDVLNDFDHKAELESFKEYKRILSPMVEDTIYTVNQMITKGKRILAEGANAALLDIDYGTYPAVTSSSTTIGGVSTGLGIAPSRIDCAIGVVKAYTTRVGKGPFPTELEEGDKWGDHMCKVGHEFGTTTGRRRRCGWLDIPLVQYSTMINSYTSLNITKLDILNHIPEILIGTTYVVDGKKLPPGMMPSTLENLKKVEVIYEKLPGWDVDISLCKKYSELPKNAKKYIQRIEELVQCPVSWIGVGPGRHQMLEKIED